MPFLESVEEGLEKAQELINTIGDEMDPQNEQERDECEAEGVKDHPDYSHIDPDNLPQQENEASSGLFKTEKDLALQNINLVINNCIASYETF